MQCVSDIFFLFLSHSDGFASPPFGTRSLCGLFLNTHSYIALVTSWRSVVTIFSQILKIVSP
jgi:hypothetical protein